MNYIHAYTCNFFSLPVDARIYASGPPAAPSNLSMSFLDGSHVLVSWVPPFTLQGTKTWYRTYVWDMSSNSTTSFVLACEGVVATNFCVYAYENTAVNRVCAEYRFATEAVNEAGASGQSAPLDAVLPTGELYSIRCLLRCVYYRVSMTC